MTNLLFLLLTSPVFVEGSPLRIECDGEVTIQQEDLLVGETEFLGSEEKYFDGAGLYVISYFRRWNGSSWSYYSEQMPIAGPPQHQH